MNEIRISEKQELEMRANASKFKNEYLSFRAKRTNGEKLTSYEEVVLEKGDDYLING